MRFSKWLAVLVTVGFAQAGTACTKKKEAAAEAPKLVPLAERSAHFEAVSEKLELGGTLFGYVDVDGDVLRLATALHEIAMQAAATQPMVAGYIPDDFAPFFEDLGLTDVKALGVSSVGAEGGGFRNRVFFYTPQGRRGLLAGLGGVAAPFKAPSLVPADADFVFETELDVAVVYAALRGVVVRAAGEPMAEMMETKLREADPSTGIVPLEALQCAKGRVSVVLRIDESRTFSPQPGWVMPVFDVYVRAEGVGELVDALAKTAPMLSRVQMGEGGAMSYTLKEQLPNLPWNPVLRIEGGVASFVSEPNSFGSVRIATLADDAAFKRALSEMGENGNGLTYVSSGFTAKARRVLELNPGMPPEVRQGVERGLAILPAEGVALLAVRQNLPDGVLWSSHWNSSLKANLVLANPGLLVGTGMMAAMAIPAFQKVRANSQEKTVLNNLRQLAAARDQFFLEQGVDQCRYEDLVGRGKYIRELKSVAGEDYTGLSFRLDEPLTVVLANGKEVSYD